MPEAEFLAWGWRVPFIFSLILVALGLFIRFRIDESPAFVDAQREEQVASLPAAEVLKNHWGKVALGIGGKVAESGLFNIYAVFVISYAVTKLGLPKVMVLNAVLIGCLVECVTLPFFGWLSDKVGRAPIYVAGAAFQALLALFFFGLVDHGMTGITIAVTLGLAIGHGAMFGAQAAFYAGLFPTRIRYSGLSMIQQIGPILGGGLSPIIAAALLARGNGDPSQIAIYMFAIALFSGLCAFALGRITSDRAKVAKPLRSLAAE
jgi:MFS family permease